MTIFHVIDPQGHHHYFSSLTKLMEALQPPLSIHTLYRHDWRQPYVKAFYTIRKGKINEAHSAGASVALVP